MPAPFLSIRFRAQVKVGDTDHSVVSDEPMDRRFDDDEAAARYHLDRILSTDSRSEVRGMASAAPPRLVPDFKLRSRQELRITNTRLLRFQQTNHTVSIFGSHVVVELDQQMGLVSMEGELAPIEGAPVLAGISETQALASIAALVGRPADRLAALPPSRTYFHDEERGSWHLAYLFRNVPAAPPGEFDEKDRTDHGIGPSPRRAFLRINYLVDAQDGRVLFYYSANPLAQPPAPTPPTPTHLHGVDEMGTDRHFFGRSVSEKLFELDDPWTKLRTYDLANKDIGEPLPETAVRNPDADLAEKHRAAVSAHYYGGKVMEFYRAILRRNGIDDKGMELVSIVNVCLSSEEPPPQWHNACWWEGRMWYGQEDVQGRLISFARHLDVIAHEVTHGVTENTANLVYRNESGALNESFSDILGVTITNWANGRGDVREWTWEIGPGMRGDGKPIRDMKDPTRTGHPDHYGKFVVTKRDNGGVHINSNIHNKAAYTLYTSVDAEGKPSLGWQDIISIYYLTLCRLGPMTTFVQLLRTLLDVTGAYFAGDPRRDELIGAVREAYAKTGITTDMKTPGQSKSKSA